MKKDQTDRREFLKQAGKVAVTAPAVAVLLSAGAKQAAAGDTGTAVSGQALPGTPG